MLWTITLLATIDGQSNQVPMLWQENSSIVISDMRFRNDETRLSSLKGTSSVVLYAYDMLHSFAVLFLTSIAEGGFLCSSARAPAHW